MLNERGGLSITASLPTMLRRSTSPSIRAPSPTTASLSTLSTISVRGPTETYGPTTQRTSFAVGSM